jgi:hypothetical protein
MSLGVEGNQEELQFGLGRSIFEASQLEQFAASELAANGWTGWANDETLAACRETPLGVSIGRLRAEGLYTP